VLPQQIRKPCTASLADVSAQGAALVLPFRLERWDQLALQLPRVSPELPEWLLATVMHGRPYAKGRWIHGCALGWHLKEEELLALSKDPATGVR
jgi:hypothetical protein